MGKSMIVARRERFSKCTREREREKERERERRKEYTLMLTMVHGAKVG